MVFRPEADFQRANSSEVLMESRDTPLVHVRGKLARVLLDGVDDGHYGRNS